MNRKLNIPNILFSILIGLTMILSATNPVSVYASTPAAQGDGIRRSTHPQTGKLTFLGADAAHPIRVESALRQGLAPEARGNSILDVHGPEFGIQDAARELTLMKSSNMEGRDMVRYQQVYNKIPVMAGELIVNMKSDGGLLSISGEVSPNLKVDTQPKVNAEMASQMALRVIAKEYDLKTTELTVSKPELWIFDERLIQDDATQPAHLVWRMDVTAATAPVRELVLVNAKTGEISLHFNQIDTAWMGELIEQVAFPKPVVSAPVAASENVVAPAQIVNMPPAVPDPSLDRFVATLGVDSGNCSDSANPCATINYAISQAVVGDTIGIGEGTYTSNDSQVVFLEKSVNLSGGWNAGFEAQSGYSTIDGQNSRTGVYLPSLVTASIDHFEVINSLGGGIYINHSTVDLEISNSVIRNNTGSGIVNSGSLLITSTSIHSNTTSSYSAGGISNFGPLTIINSVVSQNHGYFGGGISTDNHAVLIDHSTISGNMADLRGGGINSGTDITIKNSILADNVSNQGPDCYGTLISGDFNIVGNTASCAFTPAGNDQLNVPPLLSSFFPHLGYAALRSTSPAIDNANPNGCPVTDIRGVSRSDWQCDIGAYEYTVPGVPSSIWLVDGTPQVAMPLATYQMPFRIVALDGQGSPVPDILVTFEAPVAGASGEFANTNSHTSTSITDSGGLATSSIFMANEEIGSYLVSASLSGVGASVDFSLHNGFFTVASSGNDNSDCVTPFTPCASIQGVLGKSYFVDGNEIRVAVGTYNFGDNFFISKSISLTGGWDSTFTNQIGASTLEDTLVTSAGTNVLFSNFTMQNTFTWYGLYSYALHNYGTLLISNSTFKDNKGGIENRGILTVVNSTITDNGYYGSNINGYGSGIQGASGIVTLRNVTITNNIASLGGGINTNSGGGIFILENTIIAGNRNYMGEIRDGDCHAEIISHGYNLIGAIGGYSNGGWTNSCQGNWVTRTDIFSLDFDHPINPNIGSLMNLGNGVWIRPLNIGSPAIDNGNPLMPGSGGNSCIDKDQAGTTRPQNRYCDMGAVEFQFNYHPPEFLLFTYDAKNGTSLPGDLVCFGNDDFCNDGDYHAQNAHAYAYSAYQKYLEWHGRNSLDNHGMQIVSSVHYDNDYQDAYLYSQNVQWDSTVLVYGDGYGFALADDIVAHEFTHIVTHYESGLFSWYQSGAISESLSDLWGEAIDQLNDLGNDTPSVLWLIGEDVTDHGAFRSMSNPPAYNQPDSIENANYCKSGSCLTSDRGGVHINSGVNNKAVYLMVSGGSFNRKAVTALGWTKVLTIYYEAQTNLLTSGSDYLDLYNALYQACTNKVGTNGIVMADCQEVRDATDAVKMNAQPTGLSIPSFNPDADSCPAGNSKYLNLFTEDFETGVDGWEFGAVVGVPSWELSNRYASSGGWMLWANDSYTHNDAYASIANGVYVSPGSKVYLHFNHAYALRTYYSFPAAGGVLEYTTNNGLTWIDAKPLFNLGQDYNVTLPNDEDVHGNPLRVRPAFAVNSHGFVESRYYLSSLAGQTIRFRWRLGTSYPGGVPYAVLGWFVDDVQIYTCVGIPSVPTLSSPALNALLTDYSPTLNWNDSTGDVASYDYEVATDSGFTNVVRSGNSAVSQVDVSPDLPSNTKYYWRIRSVNAAGGFSAWTASRYFRTALLAPDTASPGVVFPGPEEQLFTRRPTFIWDTVAGATGYTLEVSTSSAFTTKAINVTKTATSYTHTTDLTANTSYYWRVKANGTNGPSAYSQVRMFRTANPPSAPTLSAPINNGLVTTTTPLLDWSNSTVPAGTTFLYYNVQIAYDNTFTALFWDANVGNFSVTSSSINTPVIVNVGRTYYWRVRAFNTANEYSGWSAVRSFRLPYPAPVLTLPLDAATGVIRKPTFTWDAILGATSYNLQVSTSATFTGLLAINRTVSTPLYTHTLNLAANTTYYWRVRANGAYGPGFWQSPVFSFTTGP